MRATYFKMLVEALDNARTYGNCIVTGLGAVDCHDMIGEVADLLLRSEDAVWVLCYGFCDGEVHLSLRTSDLSANAGVTVRRIVGRKGTGGGHNVLAGGCIPLAGEIESERKRTESMLVRRFLRAVGADERDGHRLIQ